MKPIIIFKNIGQAYDCLFYWQDIFGLNDWIIDINLQYGKPVIAPNWGSSTNWRAMHIAEINIPMPRPGQINSFPQRYCQELIVVHELLHVLLPNTRVDLDTTEGDFFQSESHARLECIAKSLIMTEYKIDRRWFYNF